MAIAASNQPARSDARRRRTRWLQRWILNPPVATITWLGLLPGHALIETTGRRTGRRRRTVVGMRVEDDVGWVVAERGRRAGYVRNIDANPHVRVRIDRTWRPAVAAADARDDPNARLDSFGMPRHAAAVRRFGTDLLTLRFELDRGEVDPRDDDADGRRAAEAPAVVVLWIPVGAGGHVVRHTSRWWELLHARRARRPPERLFHAALEVLTGEARYVVEMAPAWGVDRRTDRGVVLVGPVGLSALGRSRMFRYEVRCWRNGALPDREWAVGKPVIIARSAGECSQLLAYVREAPVLTWGRVVPGTGDMWNSNSLVAWTLEMGGVDTTQIHPPAGGRAPGWHAGSVLGSARARVGAATTAVSASPAITARQD